MNSFNEILEQFETAIKNEASYEMLIALFRKIKPHCSLDGETLPRFFKVMYLLLDYKEELELQPGYTKGAHIRACALGEIEGAIIKKQSSFKIDWDISQAQKYLKPLCEHLKRFKPNFYLDWKIFTKGYPAIKEEFEKWLLEMESKKKRPKGYVDGVKKAVELENLEEKIKNGEVSWEDVGESLPQLLDHPHFMVRAGAAKCIGAFYPDKKEDYSKGLPSFLAMLEIIGKKENDEAGIVGSFIDGYDGDCAGISSLHYNEEVIQKKFDVTAWILEILEQSYRAKWAPNAQSLDFYAHEYFESDPTSLKKLIKMGRVELACDAATNYDGKIEGMEEVLKLLMKSQNRRIVRLAEGQLKRHYE